MLKTGYYERVISRDIADLLDSETKRKVLSSTIDREEAAKILAKYIAEVLEKKLVQLKGDADDKLYAQIDYVNDLLGRLGGEAFSVDVRARLLLAILDKQNSIHALTDSAEVIRPETSLAQSSLFTGSRNEPPMAFELRKEILTCDRVDMLVSFIKWSGLRLIIDELRAFTHKGGYLRVITTSYMGATDIKAVEELRALPNTEIKISYDTKRTRLHAKSYVFHRDTGYTTAYVGSSNLSNAAISSGLEWNVKVTAKDLPETITKIQATFESYWNSTEFNAYHHEERDDLANALAAEKRGNYDNNASFTFDIYPYPYQNEILDKLTAEREVRGYFRNLVVAATGTGKTVISAFDYQRFGRETMGPARLLFVAHREEILKQSLACFRGVLKEPNFGELFVGGYRPESLVHLFISIQTFNSQEFYTKTTPDFYDYIVVDEFHHAAAATYRKLLNYYRPKLLLGLTATPERLDGQNVVEYFGHRIAAEIRLPEAIERKLLCPFHYFGLTDEVNIEDVKWSRGGYEKSALSNLYTGNERRVSQIVKALKKYLTDLDELKGLGFCVSKEHAEYMAMMFSKLNIPAMFLTADTSDTERNSAKRRLVEGKIRIIFVVDIYNEGVDIPEVNTILFLRPTESLTIFLQQLGRGLRLAKDKECLTVLDFIGQANKKYNFEDKFRALLTYTNRTIEREIKDGFNALPRGCYIQIEKKARDYILSNIRAAYGTKSALVGRIANFQEDTGLHLTLRNFVLYYHLDVRTVLAKGSFARLCVQAGMRENFQEELEEQVTKALLKLCAIDSRRWINFLLKALPMVDKLKPDDEERRMLNMFQFTLFGQQADNLIASLARLLNSPVMLTEILDILTYNYESIDIVDQQVDLGFACPLDVHCTYTRDQILVAMDFLKPNSVREGVKYLPDKQSDIFFVTLNKADKDYSPTTMYKDYSINERLFHWQSQSTTSADSTTGQRYINHRETGNKILLFVREFKNDAFGAAPYTFLGLCDFVKAEGSRPMDITWRLKRDIPAKYLKKTNKLVVG